ncbi:intraflagellar transport-associated protein isoform X6 [Manis pentadactyla]|uniref:intraflagellar transport-associated protein isoform X6 n=1 Tax=Manis pentadactyla TaxID=143292 RepID=UPI00255CF598|nr:intraflagellar transport-associated protein isoform X6 [Manis pentadactyla]
MTAQVSELEIMDEDRLVEEVLDRFVNCHEQTYEEFLSTFTHLSKGWLLLPGEVEQQVNACVPSYIPSVAQPVTPGVKPRHAANGAGKQMDKILGDEVQPFSLDEEFDYDTVLLTPKFTPAETDAIKELSKQKRKNSDTGVEEPCD